MEEQDKNTEYRHEDHRRSESSPNERYSRSSTAIEQEEPDIDIRAILLMLWRRKYIIVSMMVIFVCMTVILLSFIKPRYTARALVLIETNAGAGTQFSEELKLFASNYISFDTSLILNEIEVIRSRNMARKVIEKLDLLNDPEFNRHYARTLKKEAPQLLGSNDSFKKLNIYKAEMEDVPQDIFEQQVNDTVTSFLGNLQIRSIPGSYAIQIQYNSLDPAKAAQIANAVADVYIEGRLEAKFKTTQKLTDWLDGRLGELRGQVRQSETAVAEYKAQHNITEGIRSIVTAEQISQLNTQVITAKSQKAEAEARLEQVQSLAQGDSSIDTAAEILNSRLIQDLKRDESILSRKLSDLSNRYGSKHPSIMNVKTELAELRDRIRKEMDKIAKSIENEVAVAAARLKALEEGVDELKNVRNEENEKMVRLNELMREAQSNHLIYDTFLQTYKRSDEQEQLQEAEARVLSYAVVPRSPSYPDKLLYFSLALIFSLFFGVFVSLLLEKLDNTFRSASQLEKFAGYPCFALIPLVENMTQKQLAKFILDRPSSTVAEAVRTLRTVVSLRGKRGGEKPRVVTITSSFPSEGKTTLSCWLGRLAAKSGDKVILIDTDLRRPNVHRTMDQSNEISLVDYLTGKKSLEDSIQTDDPSGLHILYGKSVPNSALDLISSDKMAQLVEALKKEYDLVILDSPACLAVSDARILATYSDLTVYNVAWDRTPREVVLGGVKQFSDIGYERMAFALTNVDVKRHVKYGYGDTVYYYGHYAEEDPAAA